MGSFRTPLQDRLGLLLGQACQKHGLRRLAFTLRPCLVELLEWRRMHEIFRSITPGSRILDLGCARGSFRAGECPGTIVRSDPELRTATPLGGLVCCCDAQLLPFASKSFDAVILNHSLEHITDPKAALSEVGRVMRGPGYLYVAVPDASTFSDRLYRWIARGGGHVNLFSDENSVARLIAEQTNLPHRATRPLFSSFAFLNRYNGSRGYGRRISLVGGGAEAVVRAESFVLRCLDRLFFARLSFYGWALYFGAPLDIEVTPWSNVCVRCGAGCSSDWLLFSGQVRRRLFGMRSFGCPVCGATNFFN
jgi:SAM-dependent methyltransferase